MTPNKTQAAEPLLQIKDLVVEYAVARNRVVHAVSGVNFSIAKGKTFGLVGESGCGKSSVARAIMQLPPPVSGKVILNGIDLTQLNNKTLRTLRLQFQMIFQDPVTSLNPRCKIGKSIEAPLRTIKTLDRTQRRQRVCHMLDSVGLKPDQFYGRLPFQLSGGQCQRVNIARALISNPNLLICDEPVSSLDVSIQAQIINLLQDLKTTHGLSMLFISHDLAVVKNICDRIAVMYLGQICEISSAEKLYNSPAHPYTRALLSAIPRPNPNRLPIETEILPGEPPSTTEPPSGCRFRTRCPQAQKDCTLTQPPLRKLGHGQQVACHHPLPGKTLENLEFGGIDAQASPDVSGQE